MARKFHERTAKVSTENPQAIKGVLLPDVLGLPFAPVAGIFGGALSA